MRLVYLVAIGVGVYLVSTKSAQALARLTKSSAASKAGIPNTPDSEDDKKRLLWLDGRRSDLEAFFRGKFPTIKMSSAYRNDAVNSAVGGVSTSRHRYGLALDFTDGSKSYESHAKYLKDHLDKVPTETRIYLRKVIAETTPPHLHIEFFDKLGKLDQKKDRAMFLTQVGGDPAKGRDLKVLV